MFFALILACLPPADTLDTAVPTPPGQAIGPAGGIVEAGGVVLDIPSGALSEEVQIHIVDTGAPTPAPYEGLSTIWSFEPDGLVFNAPITVSIPFEVPSSPSPGMYWSTADGYERLDASFADGVATAQIEHFSTGFVALPPIETITDPHPYAPADLLFVVDNSCSMDAEQVQLANNIGPIFELLDSSGLDYHIGVTSTDMNYARDAGKLRSVAMDRFVTPATDNGVQVFQIMAVMGTAGFYDETGREAAYSLLHLYPDIPRNNGFYRENATLDIVFVSDEDDQSSTIPISLLEFELYLHDLKPTPSDATAHAIVQIPNQQAICTHSLGAEQPGVKYIHMANATDGIVLNICEEDWSAGLEEMVQVRLDGVRVELPGPAEIIEVAFDVNGAVRRLLDPTEYTHDGDTLRFDQGVRPEMGDVIRVDYRPL